MMLKPFFVSQNKLLISVNPKDIACLLTEKNYTKICLSDKTYYLVRSTLTSALKKLPNDIFFKIHRSYAVSIYFIDEIDKDHLTLTVDQALPISRQYYKSFINKLNIIE